jgi:hypothetical protein
MKLWHIGLVVGALSGAAAGALVLTDVARNEGFIARALAASQLSDAELQSKLQEQGYTNVQILRRDKNRAVATAMKNGQTMQLAVNGATGRVGADDDDDDD